METSGQTPRGAVHAPDLAPLVSADGPFLTVYLATEAEVENAAQRNETRWRALRSELEREQVPGELLEAIDPLVPDAHHDGQTLGAIAKGKGVAYVAHAPEPPARDHFWRWGPLPSVGPILEWRQMSAAHVIVHADRTGADIVTVRWDGGEEHESAGGRDFPIRKVHPGGWSQRRYQQRAENNWEKNAHDVAKEITRLVEEHRVRVVVLAGEVRAVALIKDALPDEVLELLVEGDGSGEDVTRAVATAVASDTRTFLEKFKEEKGQLDRAVDGPAATLQALAMAQVDVLLVHDDWDDGRTAFFGPEPLQVATTADDVRGMGADSVSEGRLVDVALRAALAGGSGVRVVPAHGGPDGAIGGLLRWA